MKQLMLAVLAIATLGLVSTEAEAGIFCHRRCRVTTCRPVQRCQPIRTVVRHVVHPFRSHSCSGNTCAVPGTVISAPTINEAPPAPATSAPVPKAPSAPVSEAPPAPTSE